MVLNLDLKVYIRMSNLFSSKAVLNIFYLFKIYNTMKLRTNRKPLTHAIAILGAVYNKEIFHNII